MPSEIDHLREEQTSVTSAQPATGESHALPQRDQAALRPEREQAEVTLGRPVRAVERLLTPSET